MLSAEPLIIARLLDTVNGVKSVQSAGELAGIPEAKQTAPALHVLYGGYQVLDADSTAGVLIRETWLVVAVVSNAIQGRGAGQAEAALKTKAGGLLAQTIVALHGWRPSPAHAALVMVNGPKPKWSAGFAYVPIAFTTDIFVKGQ